MSIKSQEQRQRHWRSVRGGATSGLIMSTLWVFVDIFGLHNLVGALIQGLLALACGGMVIFATRKMLCLSKPLSRVNWPSVYRMEREVWGRTFEHEGAPGEAGGPHGSFGTWPYHGEDRNRCTMCDGRHGTRHGWR